MPTLSSWGFWSSLPVPFDSCDIGLRNHSILSTLITNRELAARFGRIYLFSPKGGVKTFLPLVREPVVNARRSALSPRNLAMVCMHPVSLQRGLDSNCVSETWHNLEITTNYEHLFPHAVFRSRHFLPHGYYSKHRSKPTILGSYAWHLGSAGHILQLFVHHHQR